MTRVAVVGANGQVGAEVCIGLTNTPGVSVVPVVRNRLGSAFLRSSGLPCRHGRIADGAAAAGLIGDVDVIANFALGSGSPRVAHEQNVNIVTNTIAQSLPGTTIILFSTMMVYGGATMKKHRFSSYGREKLATERLAVSLGARHGRRVVVFRLGHVCGEMQNISLAFRAAIRSGPVQVPFPDRLSNTTHVVTICEAIMACARGSVPAGVYDLFDLPHWTWRRVLEHEARAIGHDLMLVEGKTEPAAKPRGRVMKRAVNLIAFSPRNKELVMALLTRFSPSLNARAQAVYRQSRARAEIALLSPPTLVTEALIYEPVGTRPFEAMTPTDALYAAGAFPIRATGQPSWPADLPLASS